MPKIKGSELQDLGTNVIAELIAKAEGGSIAKAKDKLNKAKDEHFKLKEANNG
jgi:hypothetical protein